MKHTTKVSNYPKKQGSTIFLRLVLVAMGLMAMGLALLTLPVIYREWAVEYPDVAYLKYPVLLILSSALIPFFAALYQAFRLLSLIDANKAFSMESVSSLRKIKYSAAAFSGLFLAFLPLAYIVADIEDAPGLIIINMVIAGVPMAISVFVAVLERLLGSAIAIKTENDLTV